MTTDKSRADAPKYLLPCAFCGCTKCPVRQGNGIGDYWLECTDCGASTRLREDGAGCEKDWNRRPVEQHEAAPAGALELIRDAVDADSHSNLLGEEWHTQAQQYLRRTPMTPPGDGNFDCPRCAGSGEETEMTDEGPDAREITVNCRYCDGHGTLYSAYVGASNLLVKAEAKVLELSGKLFFAQSEPPVADERAAFESWARDIRMDASVSVEGHYTEAATAYAWAAWRARASSPNAAGAEGLSAIQAVLRELDPKWRERGEFGVKPHEQIIAAIRDLAAQPERSQAQTSRLKAIIDAIEGECDGLAIDEKQAASILQWLDSTSPNGIVTTPAHAAEPVAVTDLPRFPTMLRKMWSGAEIQQWIDDNIKPLVQERHHDWHCVDRGPAAIPTGYALVPIERSYGMRAKALIAFNATEKAGQDRDDALDAAHRAMIDAAPPPPAPASAPVGLTERQRMDLLLVADDMTVSGDAKLADALRALLEGAKQ
ncbi:hypothetical protein G3O00_01510 [Burkholderia sp. Ac-20384]|uniref:hypothetical protein n=1 Tax=Burkholderia sp. Ac-20384 TaxID=2703902 RepID=UPI0019825E61|nr:hypothetical protein [Burkholderia sp. Ac-20384]MBN3822295.1 hypothetical protein [Burkholderia sp. Ac-20384]